MWSDFPEISLAQLGAHLPLDGLTMSGKNGHMTESWPWGLALKLADPAHPQKGAGQTAYQLHTEGNSHLWRLRFYCLKKPGIHLGHVSKKKAIGIGAEWLIVVQDLPSLCGMFSTLFNPVNANSVPFPVIETQNQPPWSASSEDSTASCWKALNFSPTFLK